MPLTTLTPIAKARRKAYSGRPTQARIDQLNDQFSRAVSLDFTDGLKRFASRVNYPDMVQAVYTGDYKNVMQTIPWPDLEEDVGNAFNELGSAISQTSRVATRQPAVDAPHLSLSTDNPKVDEYLDVRTASLVTNITDDIQVNIQQAVRRGIEQLQTPRDVADQILAGGIGLNQRQEQALATYKANLIAEGYRGTKLKQLVQNQSNAYLDQRAMMIARTEVSNAQSFAQLSVWETARKEGLISHDAKKRWSVDANPCEICRALDGVAVGLKEGFRTQNGNILDRPPAHPHCRCMIVLVDTAD